VVPAYQVEDYLADCLASVLSQSHRDLEVVVVDDGSTDRTGEIADLAALADPRVRVHHQPNRGLGAARNVGVALADGEYLTFVDSDDLLCPGAYERLLGSLRATGSDLAIGSVERFRGHRRFTTPLMRENHRRALRRTRIDEAPLMLADCFAWNKVYRRSFWDAAGLAFPVGVRYEDQPAITRALVEARFDSLPDPVYRWRVREEGTSLSQQRADLRDLADRVLTKRAATATVLRSVSPAARDVWFRRVLPIDMWEYFRCVPGCSQDYWALLRACVEEFWGGHTVPFEQTTLPPRQRLMGALVADGDRDQLEDLVAGLDDRPVSPRGERASAG
jgi:CDP-glycerol glycerophosphotransferase